MDTTNVKSENTEQKSESIVHLLEPPPHTRYWKPTATDTTLKTICGAWQIISGQKGASGRRQ